MARLHCFSVPQLACDIYDPHRINMAAKSKTLNIGIEFMRVSRMFFVVNGIFSSIGFFDYR